MAVVTVEWDHMQRRRLRVEVPEDATSQQITELADTMIHGPHAPLDEVLTTAIGSLSWTHPDGRFGGRAR